jgi:putative acetyltransferase
MEAAISRAWEKGMTRIELTVRTDNQVARVLYEQLGFKHEGVNRRAFFLDGQYYDSHTMARLREGLD